MVRGIHVDNIEKKKPLYYKGLKNKFEIRLLNAFFRWSGREDLNLRPLGPEPSALTKLRYAPKNIRHTVTII